MSKGTSKVTIVVLTLNSLKMTKGQLEDISQLEVSKIHAECVVVDNGSIDGTEDSLKNFRLPNMQYKFIQSGANLGFAGGNNIGIKYALDNNSDYVCILNNDLILDSNFLINSVNFMHQNPDVGAISPKMYFAKGYEFYKDRYSKQELGHVLWYAGGIVDRNNVYTSHRGVDEVDRGQYDEAQETDIVSGACMIIRSGAIKKVGLLDSSLFLYWEDADFSERLRKADYKVMYFPGAHIWHKVSTTSGGFGSATNDYFLTRNRFFYSMKYSGLRTKFAVFRDTLKLIFFGRIWQKRGALDAILFRKGMGQWTKN